MWWQSDVEKNSQEIEYLKLDFLCSLGPFFFFVLPWDPFFFVHGFFFVFFYGILSSSCLVSSSCSFMVSFFHHVLSSISSDLYYVLSIPMWIVLLLPLWVLLFIFFLLQFLQIFIMFFKFFFLRLEFHVAKKSPCQQSKLEALRLDFFIELEPQRLEMLLSSILSNSC